VRGRRAVTLVEALVAAALVLLIFAAMHQLIGFLLGGGRTSVVRLSGVSLLRQDVRVALQKLIDRIESGVGIESPVPGASGDRLVFRDLVNRRVALSVTEGKLISTSLDARDPVPEDGPVALVTASGRTFHPAHPVRIPQCERAEFQVASPTQVTATLALVDQGRTVVLVTRLRLRNAGLVED
jgi:hypothetical protein